MIMDETIMYATGKLKAHNQVDELLLFEFDNMVIPYSDTKEIWIPEEMFFERYFIYGYRVPDYFQYVHNTIYKNCDFGVPDGELYDCREFSKNGVAINCQTGENLHVANHYINSIGSHVKQELIFDFEYFRETKFNFCGKALEVPVPSSKTPFVVYEIIIVNNIVSTEILGPPHNVSHQNLLKNGETICIRLPSSHVGFLLGKDPRAAGPKQSSGLWESD